jgi:polar amino acid transport system substrate-binding protein
MAHTWLSRCLLVVGFCATGAGGYADSPVPLSACAGDTPPFVKMQNGNGVSGFSVDLFGKVAQRLRRHGQIQELPWARCLDQVRAGRVDVAIDAYDDPERHKLFLYSAPYYTLTPQIFYPANADPKLWPVQTVAQLKQFKGCGVHEYTYEHYDLDATTLDLGAGTDKQMLLKLKAKRCAYALEELEYVVGGRNTDTTWPDESDIASYRPTWARGPKLHYLVGRNRADGEELLAQINAAIAVLEKSGDMDKLSHQYLQTKPRGKAKSSKP